MKKNFELFKLKNVIKKNGKELVVKRAKKNEFGEETEEYTDLQRRIRLLYIERTEMLEVIQILESYQKRRNANA